MSKQCVTQNHEEIHLCGICKKSADLMMIFLTILTTEVMTTKIRKVENEEVNHFLERNLFTANTRFVFGRICFDIPTVTRLCPE
jgi:hypothetical protein